MRTSDGDQRSSLDMIFVRETNKAIGVRNCNNKLVWLPKSQCLIEHRRVESGEQVLTISVPEWLIQNNELTDA